MTWKEGDSMTWRFVLLGFLSLMAPAFAAPANTITLADKSGTASNNYPLQFGRPFVQGEIASFPQAIINGTPALTQADVKNRHPDGSVKFAVLAVVIPAIPANGTVTLTFRNQTSSNNTPLTQAAMLDARYSDAGVKIGTATAATWKAMLAAGKCAPWTQGPVAQTMLCADDSAARAHDAGPIRPRMHVTFWPVLNRVAVRYVGENILAGAMVDQQYDVTLTLGGASVYSKSALVHPFGTRWTKTFWQSGAPQPKINVDHNIAYLASTRAVPNFDPATVVSEAKIAADWVTWQTKPRDLYDSGLWTKYMPMTGGRADIGLMPDWNAKWLYAGDWRLREIALTQADLASAWPLHWREGRAGKKIDKAQTVDGVGLPLSVYTAANLWLPNNNGVYGQGITLTDRNTIVTDPGAYLSMAHGWASDGGVHLPSPFYVPYILTGDPHYLEQAQLWTAALAVAMTPGNCAYGEGSSPCRGGGAGIGGQTRHSAWLLNDRVNTSAIIPDDQIVLKQFYRDMIDDAIALFEGRAGIVGTPYERTPMWAYGQRAGVKLGTDSLHFDNCQNAPCESSQWQHNYLIQVLGWATERGFPTKAYRDWVGGSLLGQFADPGYNRFNIASYWILTKDAAGAWYPTWSALQTANVAAGRMTAVQSFAGRDHTYQVLARAAASFLTDQPGGQAAYDWLRANVVYTDPMASGLQWNLVARDAALPPPPPPPPLPTITCSVTMPPVTGALGDTIPLVGSARCIGG